MLPDLLLKLLFHKNNFKGKEYSVKEIKTNFATVFGYILKDLLSAPWFTPDTNDHLHVVPLGGVIMINLLSDCHIILRLKIAKGKKRDGWC